MRPQFSQMIEIGSQPAGWSTFATRLWIVRMSPAFRSTRSIERSSAPER
jgi:hypothetical protein